MATKRMNLKNMMLSETVRHEGVHVVWLYLYEAQEWVKLSLWWLKSEKRGTVCPGEQDTRELQAWKKYSSVDLGAGCVVASLGKNILS